MRIGFWEIILVIVLAMVLFGHSKFPNIMKNLAEGINIFKKEIKEDDKKKPAEKPATDKKPETKPVVAKKKPAAKKTVKKPAAKKAPAVKKK
ncbi:MAG: twin-arginine translocase TatA/TatE family subunit [Alphaproteobacteria bacterium]|nr:twin-arginine translocase TatA/TatE family subunit [Alphaproteobacteria bacterium]MCL2890106.1 twin-arginine translocase TatA/TatE family subunit [Alphaproteobacteria bacterium]